MRADLGDDIGACQRDQIDEGVYKVAVYLHTNATTVWRLGDDGIIEKRLLLWQKIMGHKSANIDSI